MILMSIALAASAAVTSPQCRTTEQMLSEAHGYFARVQPMMESRRRLSDELSRMRTGEGGKTGLASLFSTGKNPARMRETIISLGQQIELERQNSATKIAALRLAC